MSSSTVKPSIFMPPPQVKGMTEFDPTLFSKTFDVPYIKVPSKIVGRIIGTKAIREFGLHGAPGLKSIINGDDNTEKLVLFDPEVIAEQADAEEKIQEAVRSAADFHASLEYKAFTLNYQDWDIKRCLRAILPDELDFSGHTQAGHILHLNLREEIMPYRFVIGRILLDKIKYARTVVNKLDQISSEFRFFELELLAGEPDYITMVSENGFKYQLDFSKVFWNSRLNNEHKRVVDEVRKSNHPAVLFDVFAGVGPFVIPAAFSKNTVRVYANDLNPTSVDFLKQNLALNSVPNDRVSVHELDGADFIREVLPFAYKEHVITSKPKEKIFFHVLMNLPAIAVTFLSAFRSALFQFRDTRPSNAECEFLVYCYMFIKATEDRPSEWFEEQAIKSVKEQLQTNDLDILNIHYVRNVATRKNMYCVEFKLPLEILVSSAQSTAPIDDDYVVAEKKQRIDG